MTAVGEMTLPVGLTFVGTAGTITSLAAMAQQLPTYEPARILAIIDCAVGRGGVGIDATGPHEV